MKEKRIGFILCKLDNMIKRRVRNLPDIKIIDELSGSNGFIIGYLDNNKDKVIFQKDIEKTFSITRSTASKVLSLMEQKGLIERKSVDNDARLKRIIITDYASSINKKVVKSFDENDKLILKGFNEKEKEQLFSYLERMEANIKGECND